MLSRTWIYVLIAILISSSIYVSAQDEDILGDGDEEIFGISDEEGGGLEEGDLDRDPLDETPGEDLFDESPDLDPEEEDTEETEEDSSKTETPATSEGTINFKIKDIRLDDLLRMLATKAKINLMIVQPIEKKVTLEFKDNFEPMTLMEILVESYGYALVKDENIYRVVPKTAVAQEKAPTEKVEKNETLDGKPKLTAEEAAKNKNDREIVTESFELTEFKLEEVENEIQKKLSKKGTIDLNPIANSFRVTDTRKNIEEIKSYVAFINKGPSANASRLRHQRYVFQLNRANAKQVLDALKIYQGPGGKILADEASQTVTVEDTPANIEKMKSQIAAIDVGQEQVFLQCHFIEVRLDTDAEIGLSIIKNPATEVLAFNDSLSLDTGISQFLPSNPSDIQNNPDNSFLTTFSHDDFNAIFSGLANRNNARLLSSPNLLCRNLETSSLDILTKQPFVQATVNNQGANVVVTETIAFEDIGITLSVTPTIFRDGHVKMDITPTVLEFIGLAAEANNAPIIKQKTTTSRVTVKSGQAVVIGGLMEDQMTKARVKIPVLGDIPLIGFLFSRQNEFVFKTELIVYLHVTIVDDDKLKKIRDSAWERQKRRHEFFDGEFEFYPHLHEDLDVYQINSGSEAPFGFSFQKK